MPRVADRTGDSGLAALEYGRQQGPNAGKFDQRRSDNTAAVDAATAVAKENFKGGTATQAEPDNRCTPIDADGSPCVSGVLNAKFTAEANRDYIAVRVFNKCNRSISVDAYKKVGKYPISSITVWRANDPKSENCKGPECEKSEYCKTIECEGWTKIVAKCTSSDLLNTKVLEGKQNPGLEKLSKEFLSLPSKTEIQDCVLAERKAGTFWQIPDCSGSLSKYSDDLVKLCEKQSSIAGDYCSNKLLKKEAGQAELLQRLQKDGDEIRKKIDDAFLEMKSKASEKK